ncbi:MAG: hypothetical protein ABI113_02730 [Mucilaginibacter sp.]
MTPVRNTDAVNFNLPPDVLEKWTSTRKSPRSLGSKLIHPRIFSTVQFKTDRNWFFFAMTIEAATILVAIFFTGFNLIYIGIALLVVIIDVLCAIFLHKPQDEINKINCKLDSNNYEGVMNFIDERKFNGIRKGLDEEKKKLKNKKILFIIVIILVALVKSFGVIIALADESFMLFYVIPVLFALTAYVHIKHSGYYLAERLFLKELTKAEKVFYRQQALGERTPPNLITAESNNKNEFLTPALKKELDDFLQKLLDGLRSPLSQTLIAGERYNGQRHLDPESKKILLFVNPNNDNIRILYDESRGEYLLSSWGEILDDNLFALIDGGSIISDELRSNFGYCGLKLQSQRFVIGQ